MGLFDRLRTHIIVRKHWDVHFKNVLGPLKQVTRQKYNIGPPSKTIILVYFFEKRAYFCSLDTQKGFETTLFVIIGM